MLVLLLVPASELDVGVVAVGQSEEARHVALDVRVEENRQCRASEMPEVSDKPEERLSHLEVEKATDENSKRLV